MAEKAEYPPQPHQPQAAMPPPAAGYQQPPPAYQPVQPGYQQPGYQQPGFQQPGYQQPGFQQPAPQQTTVVLAQPTVRDPSACAFCGGVRRDKFTLVGIVFAVIFFPIGILCCLMMTEKRCSACGR